MDRLTQNPARYLIRGRVGAALVLVAATAGLLLIWRPYQPLAAALILALGAVAAGLSPRNGLFVTLLAGPFFLGEPQDPFVFIVEGLAGLTLLSWLGHLIAARRRPRIPYLGWLLLAGGLILFNPPLNLKELWASLKLLDLSQILFLLGEGRKFHDLFALRSLLLHLGGLAFLACCLDLLEPGDLKPLGLGMAGITAALAVAGLLLFWGVIPQSGFYLGLNLQGLSDRHHQAVLATTAFNRQYFNQLLIPFLALVGWAALRLRDLRRWPALGLLLLGLAIMLLTGQRSPFLCLGGMALAGGALFLWTGGRAAWPKALRAALALAGLLILLAALDLGLGWNLVTARFLGLSGTDQVTGMGLRPQVWRIAAEMIRTHPLTGLGPGTFRLYAQVYAEAMGLIYPGPLQEVVGTAHNTFLHWLAELGPAAWCVLLVLGGLLVRDGLAAYREGTYRAQAGTILIAQAGFLVFALFQHIFYVSAIALMVMASLASLAKLRAATAGPSPGADRKRRRAGLALGLALILSIFSVKIWAIAHTDFRPLFKAGFSYGEWYEGRERWWTVGRNAAIRYWAAHPYLIVPVGNPHPIVEKRPMKVTLWAQDGEKRTAPVEVTISDHDWHELKLDVSGFRDRNFYLRIRTGYAFWPAAQGETGDRRMLGVMVMDPYPMDK